MFEKWESGDVCLYRGDCLEVLPTLGKVDAVITDPPYGIGFKYQSHDDSPKDYGAWLWQRISAAEMLCTAGSPVFIFQAQLNVRQFPAWFPRDFRLFVAAKNFVQMRPVAMQYAYDPVVVWWTAGERWALGTQSRDWHVGNVAGIIGHNDEAAGHPCPRPLDQMEHIVEQWVRPGSSVVDCFMGSGTTGVACVKAGRRFIGIEIDHGYFEIAKRRILKAQNDAPLFKEQESRQAALEMK